jgi:hypothetical protein
VVDVWGLEETQLVLAQIQRFAVSKTSRALVDSKPGGVQPTAATTDS